MALEDPFEWGAELDGRQARLDAAMAEAEDEYEARHHGEDDGAHHRPYVPGDRRDNQDGAEVMRQLFVEFRPL